MGREPLLLRITPLTSKPCGSVVLCGISNRFRLLSPSKGQVAHALLTRSPLGIIHTPFDLHVLGTPPAFVLSQDQTLELKSQQSKLSLSFRLASLFLKKPLSVFCWFFKFIAFFFSHYIVFKVLFAVPLPVSFLVPRDSLFSIAKRMHQYNSAYSSYFAKFSEYNLYSLFYQKYTIILF